MDTVDKATRSWIMSRVRQRNTGPELYLRRELHRLGFRYRLHDRKLPGSPDLVFHKFRAVIFVHGCFWHAHDCKFGAPPSSRKRFWTKKFKANRIRDKKKIDSLVAQGWRVLVVWECFIKRKEDRDFETTVLKIVKWLRSKKIIGEIG